MVLFPLSYSVKVFKIQVERLSDVGVWVVNPSSDVTHLAELHLGERWDPN
jgi:hypothetical protein